LISELIYLSGVEYGSVYILRAKIITLLLMLVNRNLNLYFFIHITLSRGILALGLLHLRFHKLFMDEVLDQHIIDGRVGVSLLLQNRIYLVASLLLMVVHIVR
jgi:hypothetical protein